MKTKKRKIIEKKTYKVEHIFYSDGSSILNRTCDGFNPLEILGLASMITTEVSEQIKGHIKPDIINRKVIIRK